MARPFAITTANTTIQLDAKGAGEVSFTVTNSSKHSLRGRARVVAKDPTNESWLSIAGETERDFPPDATQQFTLRVQVPQGSPAGTYRCAISVASIENPDEEYADSPVVAFEVKQSEVAPKKFPWWIIIVVVAVLVVTGVVIYIVTRPKPDETVARLEIKSGDNQKAAQNSAGGLGESFKPLSVSAGAPGVEVTFSTEAPNGGLVSLANGGPTTMVTDASGVATLTDRSGTIGLYSQAREGGPPPQYPKLPVELTVTASAPGYSSVTFHLNIVAPSSLKIMSGDQQKVAQNSAGGLGESFKPLSVSAGVPGVAVTFSAQKPDGGLIALANGGPTTVVTDASGVATLADRSGTIGLYSQATTGGAPPQYPQLPVQLTVTASAPGYSSVTFHLMVTAH